MNFNSCNELHKSSISRPVCISGDENEIDYFGYVCMFNLTPWNPRWNVSLINDALFVVAMIYQLEFNIFYLLDSCSD